MPVFVFVFIWRRRVSVIERVGYIWSHQAAHTQGGQLGFRCWFGCHGAHADDIWYFFFGYCFFVVVFSISIFLGSTFNLIFRGNFLCHKILGQLCISIFRGRFFNSIFWGNFFGSQYSGATFCKHSHSRLNWVSRLVGQFVKSRGDQRQHFQDFLTPLF